MAYADCTTCVVDGEPLPDLVQRALRKAQIAIVEPINPIRAASKLNNEDEKKTLCPVPSEESANFAPFGLKFLESDAGRRVASIIAKLESERSDYARMELACQLADSSGDGIRAMVYHLNQKNTSYSTTLDVLSALAGVDPEKTVLFRGQIQPGILRLLSFPDEAVRGRAIEATRCLSSAVALQMLKKMQVSESHPDVKEILKDELERIHGEI